MSDEQHRYLIPRRITQRWELFPGWGWLELAAVGGGAVVGVVLFLLGIFFRLPLLVRALAFVLPPAAAVFVAKPMVVGGDSLFTQILALRAYLRRPRRYLYDFRREDA